MKFKIIFILGLSLYLFLIPKICLAKTIEIDSILYHVEDILEKDSFIYDAKMDTLTLKNANLKTIRTSTDLKINLIGENTLLNENTSLDSLVAKKLEISGESGSTLKIMTKKRGIVAEKVRISFANILIVAEKDALVSSSTSNYDMIVNHANLNIETKNHVFNVVSGDLYLNNANIKVNSAKNLIGGFGKIIYVNNTNLEVLEVDSIRVNQQKIYVNGNSYVFVKALNNDFKTSDYILNDDLSILSSSDGSNYQTTLGLKDKYIKIFSKSDKEALKEKEEQLNQLEKELLMRESRLVDQERNLSLKEESLKKQEEEIKIQKERIREGEKKLDGYQENLKSLENTLKEKEEGILALEGSVLAEKEKLAKFTINLKEREQILNEKEKEFLLKFDSFKDLESSCKEIKVEDAIKEEEDVIKDTLDNHSKNDDLIKNPKTYDNFASSIGLCIVSFLAFITTLVLRKKGYFNG